LLGFKEANLHSLRWLPPGAADYFPQFLHILVTSPDHEAVCHTFILLHLRQSREWTIMSYPAEGLVKWNTPVWLNTRTLVTSQRLWHKVKSQATVTALVLTGLWGVTSCGPVVGWGDSKLGWRRHLHLSPCDGIDIRASRNGRTGLLLGMRECHLQYSKPSLHCVPRMYPSLPKLTRGMDSLCRRWQRIPYHWNFFQVRSSILKQVTDFVSVFTFESSPVIITTASVTTNFATVTTAPKGPSSQVPTTTQVEIA